MPSTDRPIGRTIREGSWRAIRAVSAVFKADLISGLVKWSRAKDKCSTVDTESGAHALRVARGGGMAVATPSM